MSTGFVRSRPGYQLRGPEVWEEVRRRVLAGESIPAVAGAMGIPRPTISGRAQREGWRPSDRARAIDEALRAEKALAAARAAEAASKPAPELAETLEQLKRALAFAAEDGRGEDANSFARAIEAVERTERNRGRARGGWSGTTAPLPTPFRRRTPRA